MIFDYDKLLITTGGDNELARELIVIFLEEYEQMLEIIACAIEGNRPEEVHRAAHKFKGSLKNLGAGTALDVVVALETMGINEDLEQGDDAFEQLKTDIGDLVTELHNVEGVPTA